VEINDTLKERGNKYGDFNLGIELETNMLSMLDKQHLEHHGTYIPDVMKTCIARILTKLARISVTPNHEDSWKDIAGYAILTENMIKKGKENAENK
tara:strand:+ start:101 stop:388 length:288 start_codon:yes stop_codon:yes gene_type:complete